MNPVYNAAQREAVLHGDGPAIVLAGPGSGKTAVIASRVCHLTTQAGVDPACVLVVTFTRAAAAQMKERFLRLSGRESTTVSFGTFHSIFLTILRLAYHYSSADILTDGMRNEILREIILEQGIDTEDTAEFIRQVSGEIGLVKGERIDPANYYAVNCSDEVFRAVYASYNHKLRQRRKIDFEDMLVYTWELFKGRPDILAAWQRKFQYILVDEFQDINRLQYDIIRLLAAPEDNLFVVGDDDQSIYRFRGSRPEIMLGFSKDYPQARRFVLNVNYRCSRPILQTASELIAHNQTRYAKRLSAAAGEGDPVRLRQFADLDAEYRAVTQEIRGYHEEYGLAWREMAVLFRTNTGGRQLGVRLMEDSLPFRIRDTLPGLFEHWIARDLLAYVRAACGQAERGDWLRIINRPNRYISRQALAGLPLGTDPLRNLRLSCADKRWMAERIERLQYDLLAVRGMQSYAALQYIRHVIGYDEFLAEYAAQRHMDEEELLEIAEEVCESAKKHGSFSDWFAAIDTYTQLLTRRRTSKEDSSCDGVMLQTLHSAKGLEYTAVFIIDVNEGIIPHKKAVLLPDLEEERRMLYVAMTRAKRFLHIYYVKERHHKPADPSRFLAELS